MGAHVGTVCANQPECAVPHGGPSRFCEYCALSQPLYSRADLVFQFRVEARRALERSLKYEATRWENEREAETWFNAAARLSATVGEGADYDYPRWRERVIEQLNGKAAA